MKKISVFAVSLAAIALAVTGCSKKENDVLKVGATPEPHAAILSLIADDLAREGVTLKVVEFTDYVTPNEAVESGEIDANYFQHKPYMESFNSERGYHLVSAAGIHVEPIALYSRKAKSAAELKDGATIAIPNDPTNEGRALLLLAANGLITLDESAGLTAVPANITANPRGFKFREIEAASLPRVLADVDAAVINGNYALPAGLNAKKDGLLVEGAESPYVNVLCVKEGRETDAKIQKLSKALQSQKVKDYINSKYPNGDVVAVF
ncbi:MAG: MetQ/NlpA family ABC transporter substrate-binding protein [Treponema sp.]|nr:MetQ/NlpA family ABC transporter substrate-binding protein [Treponema sp.]